MIFFRGSPYLLYQVLSIKQFDVHFNTYEVLTTDVWELRDVKDLLDYHPLGKYLNSGKSLVPLRYYAPDRVL